MRRLTAFLVTTLALVSALVALAAMWVHLSHNRIYEGRVWLHLWGSHGVHTLDLVVLAVEAVLLLILVAVLVAGFSRPR